MISVLIVDDHQLFIDLLDHMLKKNEEISVEAWAKNGEKGLEMAREYNPDVILMDISMPLCDGMQAANKIREEGIESKIIFLTASQEEDKVTEAFRSGANGYIPKTVKKEELVLAIKCVYSGMDVIHRSVRELALNISPEAYPADDGDDDQGAVVEINQINITLSQRELMIIQMIVEGESTAEMAKKTFLNGRPPAKYYYRDSCKAHVKGPHPAGGFCHEAQPGKIISLYLQTDNRLAFHGIQGGFFVLKIHAP